MSPSFDLASHQPVIDAKQVDEIRNGLFGPRFEVPGYTLGEELGRGTFGRVYESRDRRFDRRVALKILRVDSPQALHRVEREAHALARLAHPNVIQVYDKGPVGEDHYYLALEYVDGIGLDHWLRDSPRSLTTILETFLAVAEGLAAAHRAELVHRDLKPANIMVGHDGRVRLLDFGLARGSDSLETVGSSPPPEPKNRHLDSPLTDDGHFVGTPSYAAPEQHRGYADARSDQFSYCVALFETVYGRRPFVLESKVDPWQQLADQDIDFRRRGREVPRWLIALLRQGLSFDARGRHPNMTVIVERLKYRLRSHPARMRLVKALGLTTVLTAGAMQVSSQSDARRIADCQQERTSDALVWDDGFVTIDNHHPAIGRELRAEADEWKAQSARTCGEAEPARREAIDACLGASREGLTDLVEWLAHADEGEWRHVVQRPGPRPLAGLVDTLPDPAACHGATDASEATPTLAAWQQVLTTQRLLARGRYDEAAAQSSNAIEEARRADARSIEIAAEYGRLVADRFRGQAPQLLETLELVVEARRAGQASLAADIAASFAAGIAEGSFSLVHSLESSRSPQAKKFLAPRFELVANELAGLRKRQEHSASVSGWLMLAEGYARLQIGHGEQARQLFHDAAAALGRAEPAVPPELIAIATFHEALASSTGDDPDAAIALMERALEQWRAALGPSHPGTANALLLAGSLHHRLMRFEAALNYYEESDVIFTALGRDFDRAVVRNEIGLMHQVRAIRAIRRARKNEGEAAKADRAAFREYADDALGEALAVEALLAERRPTDIAELSAFTRSADLARIENSLMRTYGLFRACWPEYLKAGERIERVCRVLNRDPACESWGQALLGMVKSNATVKVDPDRTCRPRREERDAP